MDLLQLVDFTPAQIEEEPTLDNLPAAFDRTLRKSRLLSGADIRAVCPAIMRPSLKILLRKVEESCGSVYGRKIEMRHYAATYADISAAPYGSIEFIRRGLAEDLVDGVELAAEESKPEGWTPSDWRIVLILGKMEIFEGAEHFGGRSGWQGALWPAMGRRWLYRTDLTIRVGVDWMALR